jgi:hypothetical protein
MLPIGRGFVAGACAARIFAISAFCALAASHAEASNDFHLMVGFRSVIASFIADDGFSCPDVKRMTDARFDRDGNAVMKVVCGPVGSGAEWGHRPLRVIAYTEGDFSTAPWREDAPASALAPAVSASVAAYITQD